MISAQGYIDWSTWGHDAVDVPLYVHGSLALGSAFRGSMRNDQVGQTLSALCGLSQLQAEVTNSLRGRDTMGHPNGWRGG